jgi:ABC-2 type transport system permease protein
MVAVFFRELKAYLQGLIGFIFMGLFLLNCGILFFLLNLLGNSPNYPAVLGNIIFFFLFYAPLLSMRLLSEEARQKTDQLLLTSPLNITGMVLGKYFAAQAVFLITLVITILYPILLSFVGRLAVAEIVAVYVGFFLMGSSFIAVGLFVSSLTDNQLIAAVVTFTTLLFMFIIDAIQQGFPSDALSGLLFATILVVGITVFIHFTVRNWIVTAAIFIMGTVLVIVLFLIDPKGYEGFIIRVLQWFSLFKRFRDFNRGILALAPIVYYVSFSAAFIFMTVRVIEKRRWQ